MRRVQTLASGWGKRPWLQSQTKRLPAIVKLYAGPGPNPEVAKLALAAKGMDVNRITRRLTLTPDGAPENRLPKYMAMNPAGTTPFVVLEDGTYLAESVAIARYADALFADGTGPGAVGRSKVLLLGGPSAREAAEVDMWQRRMDHQVLSGWQRQFQYGEGASYFKRHVPWVEASQPSVPGLRKMVTTNLVWLEEQMAARAGAGRDTGYIAGTADFTVVDLQLICTADFMAKVNTAKKTESFDARESFGPWLQDWAERMRGIVKELSKPPPTPSRM
jgi:glutathione S-transferase